MAEIVGKIFTKDEADKYYGNVIESQKMATDDVKNIIAKSGEYVMSRLVDSGVEFIDENRKALYPSTANVVSKNDVYFRYSKSVIEELLQKGNSAETIFQQRMNVFTVENGNYVMEFVRPCPPYCS